MAERPICSHCRQPLVVTASAGIVLSKVCWYFGVETREISGFGKSARARIARSFAVYLMAQRSLMNFVEIKDLLNIVYSGARWHYLRVPQWLEADASLPIPSVHSETTKASEILAALNEAIDKEKS